MIKNHMFNIISPAVFKDHSSDIVEIFDKYLRFDNDKFLTFKTQDEIVKAYEDFLFNYLWYPSIISGVKTIKLK